MLAQYLKKGRGKWADLRRYARELPVGQALVVEGLNPAELHSAVVAIGLNNKDNCIATARYGLLFVYHDKNCSAIREEWKPGRKYAGGRKKVTQ